MPLPFHSPSCCRGWVGKPQSPFPVPVHHFRAKGGVMVKGLCHCCATAGDSHHLLCLPHAAALHLRARGSDGKRPLPQLHYSCIHHWRGFLQSPLPPPSPTMQITCPAMAAASSSACCLGSVALPCAAICLCCHLLSIRHLYYMVSMMAALEPGGRLTASSLG